MKATCGSILGLSLVPLVSLSLGGLAITSVVGQDDVPGVGLGTLAPICDPLVSECISGDEEVQDELIAELEADDQVTAVRQDIELGELLCDSLDGAEDEDVLNFVMSSIETVTAQRTSFTVVEADVFSDDNERKVWKGEVIDPAPADGSIPRTMSMTWGTPCDVETFLLKMIDYNADGTTSITTSVPCDAGTSGEICMVQYDIDLPSASEPETPPAKDEETDISGEGRRSLAIPSNSRSRSRGLTMDAPAAERRLQSITEIDVMVLYSDDSLSRVFGGATAAQMETLIADELPKATEAATNSEINLQFNLVHTGLLPYSQAAVGAAAASDELSTLRLNTDVNALRATYAADLVVLVGSFSGTCGLGYVNFDTQVSDEAYGFSLIDARCFDSKSTTHEMGHNLGCLHDVDNNGLTPVNDYSHGQRYCTGTDTRFHTIMAYYCAYNAPTGYTGDFVPGINYFSNPNVDYEGRVTGTATKNNARTITENMEAVSNFRRPCLVDDDCEGNGTCADGVCGFTLCESVGGNIGFNGSGFCSPGNNNVECGYDGGDCCECDCTDGSSTCGVNGYDCLNPFSACSDAPVTPAPITPAPITPAPVTPAPVTPAPVTPSPVTPSPVTPAPVTPSPVTPSPVTPAPVTPSPVTPSPVTPAPVTPAPVTPAPVTPAPVTPAPVTPAPVTPAPVTTPAPITPEIDPETATCEDYGIDAIYDDRRRGAACCPIECGQCGGRGCGSSGRAYGYNGRSCCLNRVLRFQELCSVSGEAPCVLRIY